MGWSLGYLPVQERDFIDAYLLAVGKALYIASNFEKKCLWVLRITKYADRYEKNPDLDDFQRFAQALRDKLLGPSIRDLRSFQGYTDRHFEILEKGRDARNYIAHEAAALGHLSDIRVAQLEAAVVGLQQAIDNLVPADNLVSKWVYEIEEKESAPTHIQREYSDRVREWVFASVHGA